MPQEKGSVRERNKSKLNSPGQYVVVFHNDDFTPMEFVTLILIEIFFKNYGEAERLMLKVHKEGKAEVGNYSLDIAQTKAASATNIARANGYPLRITVEKY